MELGGEFQVGMELGGEFQMIELWDLGALATVTSGFYNPLLMLMLIPQHHETTLFGTNHYDPAHVLFCISCNNYNERIQRHGLYEVL